jgi:hypothetical protein
MIVEDRAKLVQVLDRFTKSGRILVGYNSDHFDVRVIGAILCGLDAYTAAQTIIRGERLPIPPKPLGCDHIDLSARLSRGGSFPSLKTVAANLGRRALRELPFLPGSILTDLEWEEVKRYNAIDLAHTWALLERFAPELKSLASLSTELSQDLRNISTPQVVERVFLAAYRKEHRVDPIRPVPPPEVIYRVKEGVRRPQTEAAAAWFDQVVNRPLPMVPRGDQLKPQVPAGKFTISGLEFKTGSGGLHSKDLPGVHYSTKGHRLILVDAASFYPKLIASKQITPAAYGSTGAAIYRSILDRRLQLKAAAKETLDPHERDRLEIQADGLKLVLNSTFGKFGSPYSTLYDPAALLAVTLTGQLMLVDLIERLTAAGVKVLSANTDGLFLRVPRKDLSWRDVLGEWQADTAMKLDIKPLSRLAALATNSYATIDRKGKIKRRGTGLKDSLSPFASPNHLIIADAIARALLEDIPPERTVRQCKDLVRFCAVTKCNKGQSLVLVDEQAKTQTALERAVRWYRSVDRSGEEPRERPNRIARRSPDCRLVTVSSARSVTICQDIPDTGLPADLDMTWYITQARKTIQKVPGYHHLSRLRLRGYPAAVRLYEAGLSPVPKRGKKQPKGSDAKCPTYLWEWRRSRTFGTYTGPLVGILVIDDDVPAKFRRMVGRNDTPLFRTRWNDLQDCLVSFHGDATADGVRTGQDRGKLIFRFEGGEDHPLANPGVLYRWKEKWGVEVFYGHGIPSVLGQYGKDGDQYRLQGKLSDAPAWLIEELTPKQSGFRIKQPGTKRPCKPQGAPKADAGKSQPLDGDVQDAALAGLKKTLLELEPKLGQSSVGWRQKDRSPDPDILIGRCPFPHGDSNDSDLSAGFRSDNGEPYVACKHTNCTAIPAICKRLVERWRASGAAAAAVVPVSDLELSETALLVVQELEARTLSMILSPMGSGKTRAMVLAAIRRAQAGLRTCLAVPTKRMGEEVDRLFDELAPELRGVIATVWGLHILPSDGPADPEFDGSGDDESEDGESKGSYPMDQHTLIAVTTHAQLQRRGFSKFMMGIWNSLGPRMIEDEDGDEVMIPPFALIIDETSLFLEACRWSIPFAHRVIKRKDPDGKGGWRIAVDDCPKSNRSGNCANCEQVRIGGEVAFNKYKIPELVTPKPIQTRPAGNGILPLRTPLRPLEVTNENCQLTEFIRVGHTTHAAPVLSWNGNPIESATRRTADLFRFMRQKRGKRLAENQAEVNGEEQVAEDPPEQIAESPAEVVGELLKFAFRPVLVREHPIDPEGFPIESGTLALRKNQGDKKWDEGIEFPRETCEVPRMQFTDLEPLEQIRRFALKHHVGVVFLGAGLSGEDRAVMREVFPGLIPKDLPYPARKIRQAAVIFADGYHGPASLVNKNTYMLITESLEAFGPGLVFVPMRRKAVELFEAIREHHHTATLIEENNQVKRTAHGPIRENGKRLHTSTTGTYLTYSRGVLGTGANILGLRFLVVDALAFRAISGFNPGELTPEAFKRARAEERLHLVMQNIGRAIRGEAGKTVVIIVLNADEDLRQAIQESPALLEGSDIPPVFACGKKLEVIVESAGRWLHANGGEWSQEVPSKATSKQGGRPKGSTKRTKESILRSAERAIKRGMDWRTFSRKHNLNRVLNEDEMRELQTKFT